MNYKNPWKTLNSIDSNLYRVSIKPLLSSATISQRNHTGPTSFLIKKMKIKSFVNFTNFLNFPQSFKTILQIFKNLQKLQRTSILLCHDNNMVLCFDGFML